MEILGIGASELFFILLIAIIVLGPRDMQKAGRTIGRWMNQFIRSDGWKALQRASREIRNLPTNLMREANIEELQTIQKDIRNTIDPRQAPGSGTSRDPSPSKQVPHPAPPPADPGSTIVEGDEPEQK